MYKYSWNQNQNMKFGSHWQLLLARLEASVGSYAKIWEPCNRDLEHFTLNLCYSSEQLIIWQNILLKVMCLYFDKDFFI